MNSSAARTIFLQRQMHSHNSPTSSLSHKIKILDCHYCSVLYRRPMSTRSLLGLALNSFVLQQRYVKLLKMQSKKLHGFSCLLNNNYWSSQLLRNTGIRNMTKIGRKYATHLLKEYISLWCIYLSLRDKNSLKAYYRMFPSCIWADTGLACTSGEQSSCSPSMCLPKLILILNPFKLDFASWKEQKKKAAP